MVEDGKYTHRIWRALDADTSYLGIKGPYMLMFFIIAGAGSLASIMAAAFIGSFITALLVIASFGAAYFATQFVQAKMTPDQFSRLMARKRLSRFSRVMPGTITDHFKRQEP